MGPDVAILDLPESHPAPDVGRCSAPVSSDVGSSGEAIGMKVSVRMAREGEVI